jgi:hypothetical protein
MKPEIYLKKRFGRGEFISFCLSLLAFLTVAPLSALAIDSDADEMSDAWEVQYGLNPNDASDRVWDADKDDFTNIEEFEGGSNPSTANSVPAVPGGFPFTSTNESDRFMWIYNGPEDVVDWDSIPWDGIHRKSEVLEAMDDPNLGVEHTVAGLLKVLMYIKNKYAPEVNYGQRQL